MFKKRLVKFLTKTFVGRITDKIVLGGAVHSTTTKTTRTNEGKVDIKEIVLELITVTIPTLLIVSLIFGWLDLETVLKIARVFNINLN